MISRGLLALTLMVLVGPTVAPMFARAQQETPPNILLIIADDLGIDVSPCYELGAVKPDMPVLESLCRDGLVFDNVWSNPTCSPTRATILTGRYGLRTGVLEVVQRNGGPGIRTDEISIQRYLDDNSPAGYANAVIGKWHLADRTNGGINNPARMGVDHYSGILRGGHLDYYSWLRTRNGRAARVEGYSTSVMTDDAINWIDRQTGPWFLWLAYTAPHAPFHLPPAGLHGRDDLPGTVADIRANPLPYYLASLEAMDREIGRLLEALSAEERANTIVMFVGDNGTPNPVIQHPYRRGRAKSTVFEGGIHVPLVVAGAGVTRRGEHEDALVNTTDLFATIAELAGVDVAVYEDSISFAGLLDGTERGEVREFAYAEIVSEEAFLGSGWAMRDETHKLIELASGQTFLFDLVSDPGETRNLILTDPATSQPIAAALRDLAPR